MDHGGNPEAGTNPWIGIDSTGLKIDSPNGPDSWVIPATDAFTVAAVFELTGIFASFFVQLPLTYTVDYTFAGLGNPDGPAKSVTKTTVAGQFIYGDPETKVSVAAGTLAAGKYELLATVTFGGAPPMSAYIELPVLDIY